MSKSQTRSGATAAGHIFFSIFPPSLISEFSVFAHLVINSQLIHSFCTFNSTFTCKTPTRAGSIASIDHLLYYAEPDLLC